MTTRDDIEIDCSKSESGDKKSRKELPRGSVLGRYVIIGPIGFGGMGTVYRAYDPKLNRGIALKILSVESKDVQSAQRAKTRLIREAQALAQLSHPNVVTIHDVGSFGDEIFIAMELISGQTLKEWLKEEKRPIKEILQVISAAGQGLSAAHQASLIHRDFKPGNVIVGDDGRIRVLDFGLVRAIEQEEINGSQPALPEPTKEFDSELSQEIEISKDTTDASVSRTSSWLLSPLTFDGGIMGTPRYMSPEQHLGYKIDKHTDQFSFCVVLYEGLYGKRPFSGRSLVEFRRNVVSYRVSDPPKNTSVPAWLREIILKGLKALPEDRHPSMDAILGKLKNDPEEVKKRRRALARRRLFAISLIFLAMAIPIGVWYGLRYKTAQQCNAIKSEFVGVWDDSAKASIRKAFLSTNKSYALGTWEHVELALDKYVAKWTQMQGNVCKARWLRATQSEELFYMRMRCMRKRMHDLKALLKVFDGADAEVVEKAVQASTALSSISICENEKALRASYPAPKNPATEAKIASIREKISEVEVYTNTGKYREGLALARKLKEAAKVVDYLPVQAEVLYHLGKLFDKVGEYEKAANTLQDAAQAAGSCRDFLLAAKATVLFAWVVGYQQAQLKKGLMLSRVAEVILDLGAANDAVVKAGFLENTGLMFSRQGDYDKALSYYHKSLIIREKTLGPEHPDVAVSLNNLGIAFYNKSEYDKALKHFRRVLDIYEKSLGPEHPYVVTSLKGIRLIRSKI